MGKDDTADGSDDGSFVVTGKMAHQSLGPGFWGLVTDDGEEYRPVATAESLQVEGLVVTATVRPATEQVSIFMWGKPIEIIDFDIEQKSSDSE